MTTTTTTSYTLYTGWNATGPNTAWKVGTCRTLDAALRRAKKVCKTLRTDLSVYAVDADGDVVSKNGR
jgi:hypothetical protein